MAHVEENDSMITAKASSGPVASDNQTPNSLKVKRKIAEEPVNSSVASASELKDTIPPVQGRKKILRKKIVAGSKIINEKKEDVPSEDCGDMKQEITLVGEESKTILENSRENSSTGNKIVRKKIVARRKIINKKKDGGDMKQKNVLLGEQSNPILENSNEKVNDNDDKVDSRNLNKDELKQEIVHEEHSKNNDVNLKKKKVIVVKKKVNNSNNKEGSQSLNTEELQRKKVISVDKSKKRPEAAKNEVEHNEKNRENFSGSRNKRYKQDTEERNGSSRDRQKQKSKEKFSVNEQMHKKEGKKHQPESERKVRRKKDVGGFIFFCSAKTKPDCFRYNIMGVSTNRQDLVLSIKPGTKLFLYDFGLKLLYGIYRACSPGGMKLEPAAFNGAFPVQVRFEIYQDCYPLPESIFKRAIEENYDGKNKFDPELTYQQVNKLMILFKPAEVKKHVSPPLYPPRAMSVGKNEPKKIETEYLAHHHREPLAREAYNYDERRRYDLHLSESDKRLAYRRSPPAKREASPDKLFLSEKDYRTHGLRRDRRVATPPRSHITPTLELDSRAQGHVLVHPGSTYGFAEKDYPTAYGLLPRQELHSSAPYESSSTASIVDSYLKVPFYGSSNDTYQPSLMREREEASLGFYSLGRRETTYQSESSYLPRREIYSSQTGHYPTDDSHGGRREIHDGGSFYPSYASKAISEYNQQNTSEGTKPQASFSTVSARYSFAGPSR